MSLRNLCLYSMVVLTHSGLAANCEAAEPDPVRNWIEQYSADLRTISNRHRIPLDRTALAMRQSTLSGWLDRLDDVDFALLERPSQIDFLLLRTELEYQIAKQRLDEQRDQQALEFLPYAAGIVAICKDREDIEPVEPSELAARLTKLSTVIDRTAEELSSGNEEKKETSTARRLSALRASELIKQLRASLQEVNRFYDGYDPEYGWWVSEPMKLLLEKLDSHRSLLRNKVVGVPDSDQETIIGLPIGAEGLQLELEHEWIAHQPSELIELAEREMAWCEQRMLAASKALGYGDDWRAAMEHVKSKHVGPGEQPQLIRKLAWEAIHFLQAHNLVTVPPLAAQGWRMTMMSPQRQRVNPYFLGGESIIVSFPTDTMTQEEKLMSMRSNNEHFSRATVHHELIPGHHLQYYMQPRYRPYRRLFSTPFWVEGWALYWEMLLWDLGFAGGPEDEIGMLFWRKHRCARIIFSLSYHLEEMKPQECVDYLVDKVGHERSAATAEVRRSIMGGYSPLYQAAYMLGGLQIRAMHEEFVQSGKMTNRDFHDAILHENSMPIEVLRHALGQNPLTAQTRPKWRFADE